MDRLRSAMASVSVPVPATVSAAVLAMALLVAPLSGCSGTSATTGSSTTGSAATSTGSPSGGAATSTASFVFAPSPETPLVQAPQGGTAVTPGVIQAEAGFHLFYTYAANTDDAKQAIYYAASPDGRSFPPGQPALAGDPKTFEEGRAAQPVPVVEGGQWILYYNAGKYAVGAFNLGPSIGRATATAPTGPWTHDAQPVLRVGPPDAWDGGFVAPNAVFTTSSGWVMFYSGGRAAGVTALLGMATSPDGVTWTKYNDPATQSTLYANSDPVIAPGPAGSWDAESAFQAAVLQTPSGYEMLYTGVGSSGGRRSIGYAASKDGIHWDRAAANPVFTGETLSWASAGVMAGSVVVVGGEHLLYFSGLSAPTAGSIGLAVGKQSGPG